MRTPALYFIVSVLAAGAAFYGGMLTERHANAAVSGATTPAAKPGSTYRALTTFRLVPASKITDPSGPDLHGSREEERDRLTCREHLLKAAQKLDLPKKWNLPPEQAADKLASMVEALYEPGQDLFSIAATSASRFEATEIANALRIVHTDWTAGVARSQREARMKDTVAALERQKAAVEAARTHMLEVMKKYQIEDFSALSSAKTGQETVSANTPPGGDPEGGKAAHSEYQDVKSQYETTLQDQTRLRKSVLRASVEAETPPDEVMLVKSAEAPPEKAPVP